MFICACCTAAMSSASSECSFGTFYSLCCSSCCPSLRWGTGAGKLSMLTAVEIEKKKLSMPLMHSRSAVARPLIMRHYGASKSNRYNQKNISEMKWTSRATVVAVQIAVLSEEFSLLSKYMRKLRWITQNAKQQANKQSDQIEKKISPSLYRSVQDREAASVHKDRRGAAA